MVRFFSPRLARVAPLAILAVSAYAGFNNSTNPPFRGQPDTEYSGWETFTVALGGPNFPDDGASTSDDAAIYQTEPGAIITSTGNIYNPAAASHFVVADSVPKDLQEVYFQTSVFGTPANPASFVLYYFDSAGNPNAIPPTEITNLWNGGGSVEDLYRWDLTGVADEILTYAIEFDALGPHMSLDAALLDSRFDDGLVGSSYCNAEVNSTGFAAVLTGTGSDVVSQNDLTLHMSDLPMNEFGYFLNSPTQGFVQNPGGSSGNLCLGGQIGRHVALVDNSGMTGSISKQVDLTDLPRPRSGGSAAVQPGETWYFQGWFRDGNTSNFTDGLAVTFQ